MDDSLPATDGKAPMIFQGIIRACEFSSDRLVRLAARIQALRAMRPGSPTELEALADNLRRLAQCDFELSGDEASLERVDDWNSAEYMQMSRDFASRACRLFKASFSLAGSLSRWPKIQLAVLEELNCFDYFSFGLVSRFLDDREIENRQFLDDINKDPQIIEAHREAESARPSKPEPPIKATSKRNAFLYSLAMQDNPILRWEQVRIRGSKEYPDTPSTVQGVIKAIREWCDEQTPPMKYPSPRKRSSEAKNGKE